MEADLKVIYRIEDAVHDGPYAEKHRGSSNFSYDNADNRPLPWEDLSLIRNAAAIHPDLYKADGLEGLIPRENYIFGFSNRRQFLNWFQDIVDLQTLKSLGYIMVVYHTDFIIDGDAQAMFLVEKSKRVDFFDLVQFYRYSK